MPGMEGEQETRQTTKTTSITYDQDSKPSLFFLNLMKRSKLHQKNYTKPSDLIFTRKEMGPG